MQLSDPLANGKKYFNFGLDEFVTPQTPVLGK